MQPCPTRATELNHTLGKRAMSVAHQNPIKVLLVDRLALVRAGLRLLIESQPGMVVVGEADNPTDAVEIAARERPDIILLEPGGKDQIASIPHLLASANGARIILVTDQFDPLVHQQALQYGAVGIVTKAQPAHVLIKAIVRVHAGEAWVDRTMMATLLMNGSRARNGEPMDPEAKKIALLTDKEREVIALLGEGLKNREIAERLSISEITVRHRLTSIFSKLGISDRLELILYAIQHNLTTPSQKR